MGTYPLGPHSSKDSKGGMEITICKINVIYLTTKHQRVLGTRSKVSVRSWSNLNWEMLVFFFVVGGKSENPEKNPRSKDKNQQQTQPTYDILQVWESNPSHGIGGRQVLSPLCHPCSLSCQK